MRCWWCIFAFGCGRLGFDALGDATRSADVAASDAPFPMGPFGMPFQVTELSGTNSDDDPSLTGDMLEIYFDSDRPNVLGGDDIWRATRASVFDPWNTPDDPLELNSSARENTPEVSVDGLTIFLASDRDGNEDIYVATRANRGDVWSSPVRIAELSTASEDTAAWTTADQLRTYLVAGSPGAQEIVFASRPTMSDPWSAPVPIAELSSPGFDADPALDPTETMIYWGSDRGGTADVWIATRPDRQSLFGNLSQVSELNTTTDDETDPWLSPDGHAIYFVRGSINPGSPRVILGAKR